MTEFETIQRAKMYMDKLAQGIDPISNQEVPDDSVLNNVRLARCFFYISLEHGVSFFRYSQITNVETCERKLKYF